MTRVGVFLLLALVLAACGRSERIETVRDPFAGGHYKVGKPYTIRGRTYYPTFNPSYDEIGIASWYGDAFHAKRTANGEIFDKTRLTAAHKTMALPSYVRVTNLENGRSIDLRVNDRGPFVDDRIIDLSEAAATELGFREQGLARVRVQYLSLAKASGRPPVAAVAAPQPPAQPTTAPPTTVAVGQPAAKPAATRTASVSCADGHFVQLGAFANADRATALAMQARSHGFRDTAASHDMGAALYKVRVGPYHSLTEAEKSRIRLAASGFPGVLITRDAARDIECS